MREKDEGSDSGELKSLPTTAELISLLLENPSYINGAEHRHSGSVLLCSVKPVHSVLHSRKLWVTRELLRERNTTLRSGDGAQ